MERRVLVIDDDAPTRHMIAAVLSREAFLVDLCADDTDAAVCLAHAAYGAVVLALVSQNPNVHSNILMKIREAPQPPCVVVISAGSQTALDGEVSHLIRARLRKPFQIAELVEAVTNCFDH